MAKVKLPRKRKKAYIKAHSKSDYKMLRLLLDILVEDGESNDRFYTYRPALTKEEYRRSKNGYVISKRW